MTNGDESFSVISKLLPVKPLLQSGPQCGLVAFCMASQLLQSIPIGVDEAFGTAKRLKFTNEGEMFSVENMLKLSKELLSCSCRIHHNLCEGEVARLLLQGNPILIPYDSDRNFEPCLRGGRTAHWAVVHGLCLALPTSEVDFLRDSLTEDPQCHRILHLNDDSSLSDATVQDLLSRSVNTFAYGSQGKSRSVGLWHLDELLDSNRNLAEPGQRHDIARFVIPDGGVAVGLGGKLLSFDRRFEPFS